MSFRPIEGPAFSTPGARNGAPAAESGNSAVGLVDGLSHGPLRQT